MTARIGGTGWWQRWGDAMHLFFTKMVRAGSMALRLSCIARLHTWAASREPTPCYYFLETSLEEIAMKRFRQEAR